MTGNVGWGLPSIQVFLRTVAWTQGFRKSSVELVEEEESRLKSRVEAAAEPLHHPSIRHENPSTLQIRPHVAAVLP